MLSKEEIYNKRETDKIGLETFPIYLYNNHFEESVANEFNQLKNQLEQEITDFVNYEAEANDLEFYLDTRFFEDKLLALIEMKIIYIYKNFEIDIKRLLGATYHIKTRELYKWDSIKEFLKTKNLQLTAIKGYQEVNQLREVNNAIKHSTGKISEIIRKIPEFKEEKRLRHYELDEFYERVKKYPYTFLESLADEIYQNLYFFDDSRLENISELFALRMDEPTAMKFIEKLKSKY